MTRESSNLPDLWEPQRQARRQTAEPLAHRMRPRSLDDFVGQSHLVGPGRLLRRMIEADRVSTVIFAGPPGTGKTSLAEIIAATTQRRFERAHAATVGVKEVRDLLEQARRALEHDGQRTILFLDEVHRFSKSQQDVLLRDVERGIISLIGATTENPYFSVNAALVSRAQVFAFEAVAEQDIITALQRALSDPVHGYGRGCRARDVQVDAEALAFWARNCDGDVRRALTDLEIAVEAAPGQDEPIHVDLDAAVEASQRKHATYDGGDAHYDTASAFIKSMRGSDPDAAVYWLARMIDAGEDPLFIARRIAIAASEDVGMADSTAIQVAAAAYDITHRIGLPEARLSLAHAAIAVALAPKSDAVIRAIDTALDDVRNQRTIPIPREIRDRRSTTSRANGKPAYRNPHHDPAAADQTYLGVDRRYYDPQPTAAAPQNAAAETPKTDTPS